MVYKELILKEAQRNDVVDKVWKKYENNTFLSSDMERMY